MEGEGGMQGQCLENMTNNNLPINPRGWACGVGDSLSDLLRGSQRHLFKRPWGRQAHLEVQYMLHTSGLGCSDCESGMNLHHHLR